jgi:hypothetical protein
MRSLIIGFTALLVIAFVWSRLQVSDTRTEDKSVPEKKVSDSGRNVLSPHSDKFKALYHAKEKSEHRSMDNNPLYLTEKVYALRNGAAIVEEAGYFGFVDQKGRRITNTIFDDAWNFKNGFAIMKFLGKYGFLKPDGQFLVEPILEEAHNFLEDRALVKYDGKWGFIDIYGSFIVPPILEDAWSYYRGRALYSENGKYGYLDLSGKIFLEPQFDFASSFKEDVVTVRIGETRWKIDTEGRAVAAPVQSM